MESPFGAQPRPMDVESEMAVGRGPVATPEVKYNEYGEPVTPTAGAVDAAAEVEKMRAGIAAMEAAEPSQELTSPSGSEAPAVEAPVAGETITITAAELQARIDAEVAKRLAERPSRAEILKKQREARKEAWEKAKKAAGAVRDEIGLVMDPDGREYVREDIGAVKDEALKRANEAKNKAVAAGTEAVKWLGNKGVEVLQTAAAGVDDVTEFVAANINEPAIKVQIGQDRFFDSLIAGARLRVQDFKIGIQGRVEGAGGFVGRVARVAEGINDVLESEKFSAVEVMDRAAERLAREARQRAEAAAAKAEGYRGTKTSIVALERLNDIVADADKKKAEDRTNRANKFPNFVSKVKKLFGMG